MCRGQAGSYAATQPVAVAVAFPAEDACARADFGTSGHACVLKKKGKVWVWSGMSSSSPY